MRTLKIHKEVWPYNQVFRISREARTSSSLIMVEVEEGGIIGRGECCPYPRYGESVESVEAQIEAVREQVEAGIKPLQLLDILPAGAARNALDCALLDLQSKQQKTSVAKLLGLEVPSTGSTMETIVIDDDEAMFKAAQARADYPLLKVKLDAENIIERISAVHAGAPEAKIIIDANEAWTFDILSAVDAPLAELGVVLLEQPLKADADAWLAGYSGIIPLCADESTKGADDFVLLRQKYDFLNIKLDKTGGLTAAIADIKVARALDFGIMVGCMVGTSLAMAAAAHLASLADYMDVDGPIFLRLDRDNPIIFDKGQYTLPKNGLWGEG